MMTKNPYDVLGVSPNASDDEIIRTGIIMDMVLLKVILMEISLMEIRTALMAMERWILNCRQLRTILTADVTERQSIHWIRFSREVRCGII